MQFSNILQIYSGEFSISLIFCPRNLTPPSPFSNTIFSTAGLFNVTFEIHAFQTILVGDSGVGKTSLLVQFDLGQFSPGGFAATVGIGFTVS